MMVLWRKGFPMGLRGFCKTEMDCMVSRTLLGRPISPQTLPENNFPHFPGIREKFRGPPWPSMVDPYWPFVALARSHGVRTDIWHTKVGGLAYDIGPK